MAAQAATGRLVPLLVVALAVAGCLSGSPTTGPAAQPPLEAPRFVGCLGWTFVAVVPSEWVQRSLPPGYHAVQGAAVQGVGFSASGTSAVALLAFHCDRVELGGHVAEDVGFAHSQVALDEAGGNERDGFNDYVFEVFLDEARLPEVAALFAEHGWLVRDARIAVQPMGVRVEADGLLYDAAFHANAFAYAEDTLEDVERDTRFHHVTDGRASYGAFGDEASLGVALFDGVLAAQGGLFGSLAPSGSLAPLPGLGQRYGFEGPLTLRWAPDAPSAR